MRGGSYRSHVQPLNQMAIEQLPNAPERYNGETTAPADRKQAPDQKPMSLDSPLLSGGAPRATLRTVYDAIAERFQCDGVREADIATFRGQCHISGKDARPLRYDAMSPAYPAAAVRLLVMPLAPSAEQQAAVQTATAAVVAALPQGGDFAALVSQPQHWHVTMFHTARLGDTRPDALTPGGGVDGGLKCPSMQRPPTDDELAREVAAFRTQVLKFSPLTLQVYRLVMADSGVLLLCCLDVSSQVAQLRGALKRSLPGAPARQTATLHVSLLRLAGGAAALTDPAARQKVQAVCDEWSRRLHGTTFLVDQVVHVVEEVFTTARGSRDTVFRLPHSPAEESTAAVDAAAAAVDVAAAAPTAAAAVPQQ